MGPKGTLFIIGGAEDKSKECTLLKKFIAMAGKSQGKIVIIAVAAQQQEDVGEGYRKIFSNLGSKEVTVMSMKDRNSANSLSKADMIRNATGIFFTGGDQLRITSLFGGTQCENAIKEAYEKGVVIAGTSAGASMVSETMIIAGKGEKSPQLNSLEMAPGLGLLPGVVVDQHFAQRGRLGRLLTAVAMQPGILGIGLDEDTGIIIKDGISQVLGSQTVTVVDGRAVTHTNVSETASWKPLALTNIALHVLPSGYGFDILKRQPLIP